MAAVNGRVVADSLTLSDLTKLINSLGEDDFLSLDSEFRRINTLMPMACLLQLRARSVNYLVDTLQPQLNLAPLLQALNASAAHVLLFSGDEDLDVLATLSQRWCGHRALPQHITDVQLMALFCGHDHVMGLHNMARDLLGIELDKSQTLSDWTARPLSVQQMEYAVRDILYLRELYEVLSASISAENRTFLAAECALRSAAALSEPAPEKLYLEVSGAGALHTQELVRLRHLVQRRYEFARRNNVALNWVITGSCLCQLARDPAADLRDLARSGMKNGAIRSYGKMVVGWCREAASLKDEPHIRRPYDLFMQKREYQGRLRRVRRYLKLQAQSHGIDPSLVASRKLVANLFYARYYGERPLLMQRWQGKICPDAESLVDLS